MCEQSAETARSATHTTRAEIEALCLLWLVAERGLGPRELAAALGLAAAQACTIEHAYAPLVARGWAERQGDKLRATASGAAHLQARLDALRRQ